MNGHIRAQWPDGISRGRSQCDDRVGSAQRRFAQRFGTLLENRSKREASGALLFIRIGEPVIIRFIGELHLVPVLHRPHHDAS